MADRAEIRIVVDPRAARAQARQAQRELRNSERQARRALQGRARETNLLNQRLGRVAGAAGGGPGGVLRAAGAVGVGAAAARFAPEGGRLAGAVGGAARVAGAAAVGFGVVRGAAEVAALAAEIINEAAVRPIVETVLREVLPDAVEPIVLPAITASIQQDIAVAIDRFQQAARFEALTAQLARRRFVPVAAAFERVGAGFNVQEAINLSENFVRASRRDSFLERQESRRTREAGIQAIIRAFSGGRGE